MIYLTILAVIIAVLVTYAIFVMPYKTDWNKDFYDDVQSFTDVGLEAEWNIPQPAEEDIKTVYAVETPNYDDRSTRLGWLAPATPTSHPGRISKTDLAMKVHESICEKSCNTISPTHDAWTCKCGAVDRYMESGITTA